MDIPAALAWILDLDCKDSGFNICRFDLTHHDHNCFDSRGNLKAAFRRAKWPGTQPLILPQTFPRARV
jgi:hypothetical protein